MIVVETERLTLRHLSVESDLDFIIQLLNQPSFLRYIGDKGVRTLDDAHQYLVNGPLASYEKNGYGLYLVHLKGSPQPIGMCGLVKRETLPDADVGFALLPEFWGKGYAVEAAAAVLAYARNTLKLERVVAITDPTNEASARVLEKVGLRFDRMIDLGTGPEVKLFTPSNDTE